MSRRPAFMRTRAVRLVLPVLMLTARLVAAQGTLNGRVTDARSGEPVPAAQVTVSGTSLHTSVDSDGRFRITGVPSAAREAQVRALGFRAQTFSFVVREGESTTLDIAMTASAVALDAIVVTGAVGDTRRRALGHSVTVVSAIDVVNQAPVANLTELLQAKTPGLALSPSSGTVGTAAIYRLRGTGSVAGGNAPQFYVDGVRVTTRSLGGFGAFGQSTTSLDAINPADIESIEVIKGPSAATLYGAEAAAGVIQILTKKGRPGRIQWESRYERGRSDWDENLRPLNYAVATPERLADAGNWPGFAGRSPGDVISFRPMSDDEALREGASSRVSLSASGGADRYRFFGSLGSSREDGVYFNNFSNLRSLRGNITFVPATTLSVTTNVALSHNHVRLPINDNAGPMGLIYSSYLAVPGRRYAATNAQGYATIAPAVANTYDNQVRADRYVIGTAAEYAPVAWFRSTLRVGLDANAGRGELFFAPATAVPAPFLPRVSFGFENSKGFIALGRPLTRDITLNYDGTASHQLTSRLLSNTSVGMQYLTRDFRRTDALGIDLGSANLRSISAAASTRSMDSSSQQKSVGLYAQQQVAIDDRLFLTVALRVDNNSAFGARLHGIVYPKASLSYLVSEAPFFRVPWINTLRLRAAWGQAGNSPGPFAAARSYTSSVVTTSTGSSTALRYASPGNTGLRPERGTEFETGFEGTFLAGRVTVDASYYRKTTRDALVPLPIPASTGFSGDQLRNLGTVSNSGVDILLTAAPIQRKWLTVDATIGLTANRNRLTSLAGAQRSIVFGSNAQSQRHEEGYPLGGMWAQRVRFNPDGSLLKVRGAPVIDETSVYMGPSVPTRELSLSGGVLVFGHVRFHGLADYKAGHYQFNGTDWRRDQNGLTWETVNPAADPDDVLVRRFAEQTHVHIQPADFVKLRDLSMTVNVPARVLRRVVRRATLTLAGHNLRIWTRYGGVDPEVNASGIGSLNRDDLWTMPQTRRYSAVVALAF